LWTWEESGNASRIVKGYGRKLLVEFRGTEHPFESEREGGSRLSARMALLAVKFAGGVKRNSHISKER